MRRVALAVLLLAGCPTSEPTEPPTDGPPAWDELQPGTLQAGAASGWLELPVGVPLSGYTGRDRALGSDAGADIRNSDYATDFQASAGWQTGIPLQAVWLTDGSRHAVIVRIDIIYTWDGLTEEIGRRLTEVTGIDLTGSVFTVTNHSHAAPGTFSNATMFYLGSDVFSAEVFDRMAGQATERALSAQAALRPAKAGLGIDLAFDPIGDDAIFRDRRGENDALPGPDGNPTGPGWKDERCSLLRVDGVDGEPIAALFAFGTHGTVMGGDNPMQSAEAPGHLPILLEARDGGPVWMYVQGAGGDASPAGRHDGFARMEYLAEIGRERVLALWEATAVSDAPIVLEPLQRHVKQGREFSVRGGALAYEPWDPSWADGAPYVDEIVFDEQGRVASPIDEFWAQHGAALCGDPSITLPTLGLGVEHPAYKSCVTMESGYILFHIAFPAIFPDRDAWVLPLPEAQTTMIGALGMRPLPVTVLGGDGSDPGGSAENVVFLFAPGEPTTLWTQFLRAKAAEAGAPRTVVFGYAMDHEGYLLTAEDWLQGGYEPSISVWGPLQGEVVMERMAELATLAHSVEGEDPDWPDWPQMPEYPSDRSIPTVVPDVTAEAGTVPGAVPAELWSWDGVPPPGIQPDLVVPRVQGVARFVFFGNDPAMGNPNVVIEHDEGGGNWQALQTPSGWPIDDHLPDILMQYTPVPLVGTAAEPDPVRQHVYVADWQAVSTWAGLDASAALPLGAYRFRATGLRRDPADGTAPFDGIPWELMSITFEVGPAAVSLQEVGRGDGILLLDASYAAPPRGFRLVHREAGARQASPLPAAGVVVTWDHDGGSTEISVNDSELVPPAQRLTLVVADLPAGEGTVHVDDGFGNVGTLPITLP